MEKIISINPFEKTKSGRMRLIKINYRNKDGRKENKLFTSAQFRLMISPWIVRSTKFINIAKEGDNFKFTGRGWGHGVGMCQWGAKGMAEAGYDYERILDYYYPDTEIEKLKY